MAKKKEFNLNGYIFGALRKIWRWHPARKEALNRASNGLQYTCEVCYDTGDRKLVHVDHIDPVIDPVTGFTTWDNYIVRLFVTADRLQVVCKKCHKLKTDKENKIRRENKDA